MRWGPTTPTSVPGSHSRPHFDAVLYGRIGKDGSTGHRFSPRFPPTELNVTKPGGETGPASDLDTDL